MSEAEKPPSDADKPPSEATQDELAAYAANVRRRKRRLAEAS